MTDDKPQTRPQQGARKPPEGDRDEKRTMEQRIADLELQLAQSRATSPLGTTPNHGAGVGENTAETWSMHDQRLAYEGIHPDQDDNQDD